MRRILLAFCCLLALGCAPRDLTPAQFTDEMRKAVATALPAEKVQVKADLELRVTDGAGKELNFFLHNAYDEYVQAPDRLQEIVVRHAESLRESSDLEAAIDRAQIVPILKDRAWIAETTQAVQERGAPQPAEYVSEEYNEQLVILYAEDRPKNIRYLTPGNLAELGIAREELRALAVTNLRRILPGVETHAGPLVSRITAGGNYEACLLLLDNVWTDGSIAVAGDPVVAIPTRDLLLVTGTKTPGGIAKLRELASKSIAEGAYRLTDGLFVYRDGKFIELAKP